MTSSVGTVQVWSDDRKAKVRDLIRQLYSVVAALEEEFEGRKFTPDGHLVGSIGEVVAAYAFGLKLLPASNAIHDAVATSGTLVQIKFTGGDTGVSLYSEPEHLLVLQLRRREFVTIYNGRGARVWENCRPAQKNGQRTVALSVLRKLNESDTSKLAQVNPYPSLED